MNLFSRPWYVYACVSLALCLGSSVFAHGYSINPPARNQICAAAGGHYWPADGSGIADPACRAAYMVARDPMLYTQVHEYAINIPDFRNQAAVETAVPDGLLCSAGNNRYRGMSIPRNDWQKTPVPSNGGSYAYTYNATVPHSPSYFEVYISKPSYDAGSRALGWGDLEPLGTFNDIPLTNKGGNRVYEMNVNLPSNRSGDEAVLFVRWQRIDAGGEGFYSCSDIVFGASANPNPAPPTPAPEPEAPTPTPTPTPDPAPTPNPAPTPDPEPSQPTNPDAALSVEFGASSSWDTGFNGAIRITNNGAAINDWTLDFTLADGASAGRSVWGAGGSLIKNGDGSLTVKPNTWGGSGIGAGQTIIIYYSGSGQHQGAQSCTINGASCD